MRLIVPDYICALPAYDVPSIPPQQQQMRANVSGTSFPSELRDLLQRRLGELEKQLLKKVSNLEEEKSMLSNATAAYRLKTESTLNALVERISELEKGTGKHQVSGQPATAKMSDIHHHSRKDIVKMKYWFEIREDTVNWRMVG